MGNNLTHTVSGNIASFKSADIMPIESLKCHFLPMQEGSEDPSPSNIRSIIGLNELEITKTGKNLLNPNTIKNTKTYTTHGITFSMDDNGIITAIGTNDGTSSQYTFGWKQPFTCDYYFCAYPSESGTYADAYFWDMTTDARCKEWDGTTTSQSSFKTNNVRKVQLVEGHEVRLRLRIFPNIIANNISFKPMLLSKDCTDTTFEPYCGSTIPITFPIIGKNRLDPSTYYHQSPYITTGITFIKNNDGTVTANGTCGDSETYVAFEWIVPFTTNCYFCSNLSVPYATANIYLWDATLNARFKKWDGTTNSGASSSTTNLQEVQLIKGHKASLRCRIMAGATIENLIFYPMILLDSCTDTTYEQYNSNNTIYGGYVDIAKGEVVTEYELRVFDGTEEWVDSAQRYHLSLAYPNDKYDIGTLTKCSHLTYSGTTTKEFGTYRYNHNSSGNAYFQINDLNDAYFNNSLDNLTNWLSTQYQNGTPVQLLLPLKYPIHYPLSKTELKTFLDQNNIWSNTNDITEVTYQFQDHLLNQRMLIKQPHIETIAGPTTSFNTNLNAPLRSTKINFSPLQKNKYNTVWMADKGKNKLGFTAANDISNGSNGTITFTNDYITVNAIGGRSTNVIVSYNNMLDYCKTTNLPAGTYTFSVQDFETSLVDVSKSNIRIIIMDTDTSIQLFDGDTFTLQGIGSAVAISYSSVISWGNGDYMKFHLQIEEGSSVTAWEPYENICPIGGWDQIKLIRNDSLIPINLNGFTTGQLGSSNGIINYLGNNTYEFVGTTKDSGSIKIPIQSITFYPNKRYRVMAIKEPESELASESTVVNIALINSNSNNLFVFKPNNIGWTNNICTAYTDFNQNEEATVLGIGIPAGNSSFKFKFFISEEIFSLNTIDWSSTGETIYGGYIDLNTGEVWKTWEKITLDGVTTNHKVNSDYSNDTYIIGGVVYLNPTGAEDYYSGYRSKLYCNKMRCIGAGDAVLNTLPFIKTIGNGAQYLRIYLAYAADHTDLDTAQKRKDFCNTYLAENPIDIVYPLKNPQLVTTLTPIQLKSFISQNNIWSNANGNTEIKYWKY